MLKIDIFHICDSFGVTYSNWKPGINTKLLIPMMVRRELRGGFNQTALKNFLRLEWSDSVAGPTSLQVKLNKGN